MHFKAMLIPAVAVTALVIGSAPATADTVGEPGTPNCFGKRFSHASSDHKLSPKTRAGFLQEAVDAGVEPFVTLFGEHVSVGEVAWWVRTNCSDNPIF